MQSERITDDTRDARAWAGKLGKERVEDILTEVMYGGDFGDMSLRVEQAAGRRGVPAHWIRGLVRVSFTVALDYSEDEEVRKLLDW